MRDLIRHKVFIATFLAFYFLFFIVTITIFDLKQSYLGLSTAYGFPFTYYISHCYGGSYIQSGLLGNILFAAILGTILGLIFSYLWKKLTLRIKVKQSPRKPRKKKR